MAATEIMNIKKSYYNYRKTKGFQGGVKSYVALNQVTVFTEEQFACFTSESNSHLFSKAGNYLHKFAKFLLRF